ncbi:hypothetical protein M1513_01335 [Patescibacteria group bacterium]|nr:hypothetical protein [Patescibacteria group bacterium]MCL5733056.1 hypothetical protein [Patescibacteria group bacterium]
MKFEQKKIENGQNYQENLRLLENANQRFEQLGLFSEELINDLKFEFYGDFRKEKGGLVAYKLNKNNLLESAESDRPNVTKDVRILSSEALKKHKEFSFDVDDKHLIAQIWLEGSDMNTLYSFNAVTAHEIAHAKSYRVVPPNSELFNKEQFFKEIKNLAHQDQKLEATKIDFSRFYSNYATTQWSELYAMIYQREFVRRDKPSNEKYIKDWDDLILQRAGDLDESAKNLSSSRGRNLSPDLIYSENHTLSFLMSRVIENKYPDFEQRVNFLESFASQFPVKINLK